MFCINGVLKNFAICTGKHLYWSLFLRILTGKKHPQIKLQRFRKLWISTLRWLVHQINCLYEVLKLKQNFRKNKGVTGKTPLFVIGSFILFILFVLILASPWAEDVSWTSYVRSIYVRCPGGPDWAVLYGSVAFPVLVLSTKKQCSRFLRRVSIFQKNCFKVELLKTFKISVYCHIKTCLSLKRRANP